MKEPKPLRTEFGIGYRLESFVDKIGVILFYLSVPKTYSKVGRGAAGGGGMVSSNSQQPQRSVAPASNRLSASFYEQSQHPTVLTDHGLALTEEYKRRSADFLF